MVLVGKSLRAYWASKPTGMTLRFSKTGFADTTVVAADNDLERARVVLGVVMRSEL